MPWCRVCFSRLCIGCFPDQPISSATRGDDRDESSPPTQYARNGEDLIILVGRPETKTWWRNFRDNGEIDVLVQRQWLPMTARAVIGADEPETIAELLEAYLQRFPRAASVLRPDTHGSRNQGAVVLWCRPR